MSAIPGGGTLSIEWISRMQSLENDNNKLKKQLADIKSEMKATVAVDKELDKQRAEAAKAQERRTKAELNDINRLAKARDEHARKELSDIHSLDIARIQHIDREKKGELAEQSRIRSRLLQEEERNWNGIATTVRGTVTSAVSGLGITVLSVAGAIAGMKSAIDDVKKSAADAGARDLSNDPARRTLAGYLTTAQLPAGQRKVAALRDQEGMSEAEATQIVIEAYRSGQQERTRFLGSLGDIGVNAPAALSSYREHKANFGRGSAGSFKSYLNRALVAQEATGTPAADIMGGAAGVAPSVSRMTGDELLATTAVLGQRMGTEKAGGRLKNVVNKLGGLRGKLKNLPPGMENLSDLELIQMIPWLEANGYIVGEKGKPISARDAIGRGSGNTLRTIDIIRESSGEISSVQSAMAGAAPGAAISARFGAVGGNPAMSAADAVSRNQGGLDRAKEERLGTAANLVKAYFDAREKARVQAGYSAASNWIDRTILETDQFFQGNEAFLRGVNSGKPGGGFLGVPGVSGDPELKALISEHIRALDANTAATNQNTSASSGGQRSGGNPNVDR